MYVCVSIAYVSHCSDAHSPAQTRMRVPYDYIQYIIPECVCVSSSQVRVMRMKNIPANYRERFGFCATRMVKMGAIVSVPSLWINEI